MSVFKITMTQGGIYDPAAKAFRYDYNIQYRIISWDAVIMVPENTPEEDRRAVAKKNFKDLIATLAEEVSSL